MSTPEKTYSAFFYGTLLHPAVLKRVIRSEGAHLTICPAILKGYTRHQVTWADFPAIISSKNSAEFFKTEPRAEEDDFVQGSLVIGLTEANMTLLDYFEGSLYRRENIEIHTLAELVPFGDVDVKVLSSSIDRVPEKLSEKVDAMTYVWADDMSNLKKETWSFDEFVETKLSGWM